MVNGLVAFFDFSFDPSEWWTGRAGVAAYISGIVVRMEQHPGYVRVLYQKSVTHTVQIDAEWP